MNFIYKLICMSLPFLLVGIPILAEDYNYYCVGNTSYENTSLGTNSISCSFGCDNSTFLTYHQGSIPQADLCNSDPFYLILEGMAIFIGMIIIGIWIYKKVKEWRAIRLFAVFYCCCSAYGLFSCILICQINSVFWKHFGS